MPTLPNLGLVTPVQGADRGTWDDKINAAFALVDAHDHTSGKGVAIVSAALNIDDDVAWGGFAITALGTVAFTAIPTLAAGALDLFVDANDHELYWRNNSGTNVKLTSGTSINTTLVGGIVGDYAAVGAEVAYDDANKTYTFKDQSTPSKKWARLASGPVRIHQFDTTESEYVEFAVDDALAASYTIAWPAALPGDAALVQIDDAGVVSFSNTTTQAITAADFKNSTALTISLSGCLWVDPNGTHTRQLAASGAQIGYSLAASTDVLTMALPVKQGDRITAYAAWSHKDTTGGAVIATKIWKQRVVTLGTESTASAGASNNVDGAGYVSVGETGLAIDIAAGFQYYLVYTPSGSVTGGPDQALSVDLSVVRP